MSESLSQVYEQLRASGAIGEPMSGECQCRGPLRHPEGHWNPNASQPFHMAINSMREIAGLHRLDNGELWLYRFEAGDATWRAVRQVTVGELEAIGKQIKQSSWQKPVNTEG